MWRGEKKGPPVYSGVSRGGSAAEPHTILVRDTDLVL